MDDYIFQQKDKIILITYQQHSVMSEDTLTKAFVGLLQALGYKLQSSHELYNGVIICQLIASIENSQLSTSQIIRDEQIFGASLSNLRLINVQIQRYNKINLKNDKYQPNFSVYLIHSDSSEDQLIKLLKQCFVLLAKAPNYSYFIQKVLTLPQNAQLLLADLLKQDGLVALSPHRQNYESDKISNKQNSILQYEHPLDLIDKLYEMELQNQRLQQQLKRYQQENNQAHDHNIDLMNQIQTLRSYSENLKTELIETSETVLKLRNRKEREAEKQNKNDQSRRQLEKIIDNYKQQIQFIALQAEGARKKYQARIKQLEFQLRKQKQVTERMKQEIVFSQQQMQQLISKCEENQSKLKTNAKSMAQLQNKLKQVRQSQNALKFEINYKNSQIQELKQIILNANNSDNKSDYQDHTCSDIKSPRMLTNQFANPHQVSSPRGSVILKLDAEQIRSLKAQIKQLQRQNQKLKKLKNKNKQLEYEKNKLVKILNDYQSTRGEENDIITGCLYQLQMKFSHGKASFSNSTLPDDFSA